MAACSYDGFVYLRLVHVLVLMMVLCTGGLYMCLYLCVMVLFFDLFVVQTCRMMMRRSSLTPRTSKAWLSWRRKGDRIRRRITDLREKVREKVM